MQGKEDEAHLRYATANNFVLLTKNCSDFEALHKKWKRKGIKHSGILLWYQYNNPKKDIKIKKCPRILKNIISLKLKLENKIYKLNDFNY